MPDYNHHVHFEQAPFPSLIHFDHLLHHPSPLLLLLGRCRPRAVLL